MVALIGYQTQRLDKEAFKSDMNGGYFSINEPLSCNNDQLMMVAAEKCQTY